MKIIEIEVEAKDVKKMKTILDDLAFVKSVKEKQAYAIDKISLASESSLAEDWNSPEDARYDAIYNK